MITELKNNLRQIYNETREKLLPENIKKDINILGVAGTLEIPETKDKSPEVSLSTFSGNINGEISIDTIHRNSFILKDKLYVVSTTYITIYNYKTGAKIKEYLLSNLIGSSFSTNVLSIGANNPNNIGTNYYYICLSNTSNSTILMLYNYDTDEIYSNIQDNILGCKAVIQYSPGNLSLGIISTKHNKIIHTNNVSTSAGGSSYGGITLYTIDFTSGTTTSKQLLGTDGFWAPYPVWLKNDRVLAVSTFYNDKQWTGQKHVFIFDEDITTATQIQLQDRYQNPSAGFTFNQEVTKCFKGSDLYNVNCNLSTKELTMTLVKENALPADTSNYQYATNGIYVNQDGTFVLIKNTNNIAIYKLQADNTYTLLANKTTPSSQFITPGLETVDDVVCTASAAPTVAIISTTGLRQLYLQYEDKNYYNYSDNELDVTQQKVLLDTKFLSDTGIEKGTMPNNGELNYTSSTEEQIIPAGYTSGGTIEAVTSDIDINIAAENIKKDVTILGVTGTYEGSGGTIEGVKLFSTVEEMQADAEAQEGDLAIVYKSKIQNATVDSKFQIATFPDIVVLDTAITDSIEVRYSAVDSSITFECWGSLDSSNFMMNCHTESSSINIQYTSEDGINYTRTDTIGNPVDFGTEIHYAYTDMWNDAIGKFIQLDESTFKGLFDYSDNSWSLASTQLSAIADYVYEKEFYGKNGLEIGKLQNKENLTKDEVKRRVDIWANYSSGIVCPSDVSSIFTNCTNLTTIPQLNTSNVTDMSYMFNECANLTAIPLLDTSNVTNMSSMFQNCKSLTEIPLLDTSKVTNMYGMFWGCTLTEIPLLDTSSVIDMGSMFGDCTNLTTIYLLDTSSVTNMHYMFYACDQLLDESLNNILAMCVNAVKITDNKTLAYIGLTSEQATKCTTLSNYSAFTSAGWTTGY